MKYKFLVSLVTVLVPLLLIPMSGIAQGIGVVSVSVTAGTDDGYHRCTGVCGISHDLQNGLTVVGEGNFLGTGADWDNRTWLRFNNITIDQLTAILSADVTLTANATSGVPPWRSRIDALLEANPAAIADDAAWHARVPGNKTVANVDWNPVTWNIGFSEQSPDLTTVIQELVDQGGWVSGNSIIIHWYDPVPASGVALSLWAEAFEGTTPAQLNITYTIPAPAVTVESVFTGWVSFMGIGFILLLGGGGTFFLLFILKVPPLMMLVFAWLVLILFWTIGIISPTLVLVSVVLFTGAILFKLTMGSGETT